MEKLIQSLILNVLRTPSISPEPKNCAPKIPGPETPPKMHRLKTITS